MLHNTYKNKTIQPDKLALKHPQQTIFNDNAL